MGFDTYLFDELERTGVVKNYDKTPHAGKGRKPVGNLSVNLVKILEFKKSESLDNQVWGLIAYAGLVSDGVFGAKLQKELDKVSSNIPKLKETMIKSAALIHQRFTSQYRKY